jgi:hypothetical protein
MPWQIVVALVFIGVNGLSFALQAASLGTALGAEAGRLAGLMLTLTIVAALQAAVSFAVGACIAARLNWARRLAVLANFVFVLSAVGILAVLTSIGEFSVLVLASGALSLFMIALLSNERSQAYTYKGGDDGWPED